MSERAVGPILGTVTQRAYVMDAHDGFVVARMVTSLCVTKCPVEKWALVMARANAQNFVVLNAVRVGAIVESGVGRESRPPAPLVREVPVEAGVWLVVFTLVVWKVGALVYPEVPQIALMGCLLRRRRLGAALCTGHSKAPYCSLPARTIERANCHGSVTNSAAPYRTLFIQQDLINVLLTNGKGLLKQKIKKKASLMAMGNF